MALEVYETFVNDTTNTMFGESGEWTEAYHSTKRALFRSLQKEYGGCIGKMYNDVKITEADTTHNPYPIVPLRDKHVERWETVEVGWVFAKRMLYEDARKDTYTGRYSANDYYMRHV